jgi:cell division protein FtsI/penicillin-binding protein 2
MGIRHTFPVHRIHWMIASVGAIGLLILPSRLTCQTWVSAVRSGSLQAPEARIVVLDVASGKLLASHKLGDGAHTLAAPGSTLKPLVLYGLVNAGRWNPALRITCNRQLVIAGHRLACSHPQAPPFNASEALTWSCNSYFAALARTLRPGGLGDLLRPTGLLGASGLVREETVAEFREPASVDDEQLTLLGVDGVRVTPLELAAAYRWLALELAAHPGSQASRVVRAGLEDSASFGMAGQASLGGVPVMGKTGTADSKATGRSHGWFVGMVPAQKPSVVIVIYLPVARGADAAHMAGEILSHAPLERP